MSHRIILRISILSEELAKTRTGSQGGLSSMAKAIPFTCGKSTPEPWPNQYLSSDNRLSSSSAALP